MKLRRVITGGVALVIMLSSAASMASVRNGLSTSVAPPELPVYQQPPLPSPGEVWVPGYWAWEEDGYYWVPGTWVFPPEAGLLWTPGYWARVDGSYSWHTGYWGRHLGYYGGINYGFGYFGVGYEGGYWDHDSFYYNRACNNLTDIHIPNVYNRSVVNNVVGSRVSYNGGAIGVHKAPTQQELSAAREYHLGLSEAQVQQEQAARNNPELRARFNRGHPPVAATPRPGAFHDPSVILHHGFSTPAYNSFERSPPPHALELPRRYAQAPRDGYVQQNHGGPDPAPRDAHPMAPQ